MKSIGTPLIFNRGATRMDLRTAYDIDPEFEHMVLAAVCQDFDFLERFKSIISKDMFSHRTNGFLVEQLLLYHDKYECVPVVDVLVDQIKATSYRDKGGAITTLQNLPVCSDLDYVRDKLLMWVKWTSIDKVLQNFDMTNGVGIEPKILAEEIDEASRIGDDLLREHTLLHEDSKSEENDLQGRIIKTPWAKLNHRLNGGCEVGDLAVVLTVVNGGKTTVLVNVAVNAVCRGLSVIYFTFEDGETKIKRRILQAISGKTISEMIGSIKEVRAVRDKLLEKTGGRCEIKQLQTRMHSVADLISFVRTAEQAQDRKVDVVITDYADRFRPPQRREEPRHEYREIFEACKAAAVNLGCVHWTASQVNKSRAGKEIISSEDVTEAYGKIESADLVLGFGQTLEDEELNRMTMYSAKVRDAKKHEKFAMEADFEKQMIREIG